MTHESLWLVLLETSGNQAHITETNKLAENIGASEQIYRIGNHVVAAALWDIAGVNLTENERLNSSDRLYSRQPEGLPKLIPKKVLERAPIGKSQAELEVWYTSSGKALVFSRSEKSARELVSYVTGYSLRHFPGVDVRGAYVETKLAIDDINEASHVGETRNESEKIGQLADAVKKVHQRLASSRSHLRSREARFQRLPIVAECKSSGLPASELVTEGRGEPSREASEVVAAKRRLKYQAFKRMQALCGERDGVKIADNINRLDQWLGDTRFLGMIHADGMGVGKLFQDFSKHCFDTGVPQLLMDYIQGLRKLSYGIDECTRTAFQKSVRLIGQRHTRCVEMRRAARNGVRVDMPILPLIVGGDDVTILCAGWMAIPLVREFLQQFEIAIQNHPHVGPLAKRAFGVPRLGMCAGIALVKPHYPFSASHALAVSLENSAKNEVKRRLKAPNENGEVQAQPVCAFDFHVHHTANGDDIHEIRKELTLDSPATRRPTRLWGGPYLVSRDVLTKDADASNWIRPRTYEALRTRTLAIVQRDETDDRRLLPSHQLHDLRQSLFDGPEAANARLELILSRYGDAFKDLLKNGPYGLFWIDTQTTADHNTAEDSKAESSAKSETYVTGLLDAMALSKLDAIDLLQSEINEEQASTEATPGEIQ